MLLLLLFRKDAEQNQQQQRFISNIVDKIIKELPPTIIIQVIPWKLPTQHHICMKPENGRVTGSLRVEQTTMRRRRGETPR